MNIFKAKYLSIFAALALAPSFVACDKDNDAEDAMEDVGDKAEDVGDKVEDKVD